MNLAYYFDGEWIDISDSIDYSATNYVTNRIDDIPPSGAFKCWLDRSENIPPYTPFLVDNQIKMVGGSEVSDYLTESDLYVHDIDLLDPVAVLNCFNIGVKMYSNSSKILNNDAKKFLSLLDQAHRMYPEVTFIAGDGVESGYSALVLLQGNNKTYNFDAKSTLYSCLNEIVLESGLKLNVDYDIDNPMILYITIKYPTTNLRYKIKRLISNKKTQSKEDYGRYLETYASNVVDRDTATHLDFIGVTTDSELLNADTAKIKTPTPIESIIDFGVRVTTADPSSDNIMTFYNINYYFPDGLGDLGQGTKYYIDLANKTAFVDGQIRSFFNYIYDTILVNNFPDVSKSYFIQNVWFDAESDVDYEYEDEYGNQGFIRFFVPTDCYGKWSKMEVCLEKNQYDILTPQEQASRVFYEQGGRTIENLNGKYNNDLWNILIGQSRGNFLEEHPICSMWYFANKLRIAYNYPTNGDIVGLTYYVDYTAITNPYLRDTKSDSPTNESQFKPFSRSYGVSSNFIDFNKIIPNMEITNNMLGVVEKVIEDDITESTSIPIAGYRCEYENEVWYISNVIIHYHVEYKTATITLVKHYQKKAQAIGVDSQAESTNNPLHSIIIRPIYQEGTTVLTDIAQMSLYARFRFYDVNDQQIVNVSYDNTTVSDLYKPLSVQAYNDTLLLFAEMLDQIYFEYGRTQVAVMSNNVLWPYKYCDNNAEVTYVQISICTAQSINHGMIITPQGINGSFSSIIDLPKIKIDKDAREKLTFSLKLKIV